MTLKIAILEIQQTSSKAPNRGAGGGYNFLTGLKVELDKRGLLAPLHDADCVIINSHHLTVFQMALLGIILLLRPKIQIVHRIDGPVCLVRGDRDKYKYVDSFIKTLSVSIADSLIFQTKWSKERVLDLWNIRLEKPHRIILNGAKDFSFNRKQEPNIRTRPYTIVMTSWSPNINKGFDDMLDFDDDIKTLPVDVIFIGNSAQAFQNIKMYPPQPKEKVAKIIRASDCYITFSRNDPCSNALIEALNTGVDIFAKRSGGHPEILGPDFPGLFDDVPELVSKIRKFGLSGSGQCRATSRPFDPVVSQYIEVCEEISGRRLSLVRRLTKIFKLTSSYTSYRFQKWWKR